MGRRREQRRAAREQDQQLVKDIVQPVHQLPLYELLDAAGVQRVHDTSMEILSEVGIAFYDEESVAILREHGVRVDENDLAYFDESMVMEYVSKAPSQFTQLARNPQNNLTVGGNNVIFAPVYGPPFLWEMNRGRRSATLADFQSFVKLAYLSPNMHHSGGTVIEPTDEPTHTRHLDMILSHIKYSDKAFMGSVTSANNAADSVAMSQIVFGADAIRENPAMVSLINISSPRRLDDRMLGALKVYARANQGVMITPFILSGAMSPTSVAGTLVQANAEALAGIAFAQMVNPGTPTIYGTFQAAIDMQSGAPVLGAPESQTTLLLSAQMARHYNLPFRSGGALASSKIPDAQAAYESAMMLQATVAGRVNFVLHAAGWLEGGLAASFEKFVLDCEILGMMIKLMQPVDLSDHALAMGSIRSVEPGGHHLGTEHTMQTMRTAFYQAELFDFDSAEQWEAEGSKDAVMRANAKYKQMLTQYEAPELDPAAEAALMEFVDRRKQEIKPEY
jgi:trimethylamine--corrinoid protein Co-methyltransferase